MPALPNTRHELFALYVARGENPAEAYKKAGFSPKGASQGAYKLKKIEAVATRIAELCFLASQIPLADDWLKKSFVLEGLRKVFVMAMDEKKLGDAIRALELMGKHLGMFVDRTEHTMFWDGDPAKLTDGQLEVLTRHLERLAYGDDKARLMAEKRQAMIEAGATAEIIEAEFAAVAEPRTEEPGEPEGWE